MHRLSAHVMSIYCIRIRCTPRMIYTTYNNNNEDGSNQNDQCNDNAITEYCNSFDDPIFNFNMNSR